MPRSVMEGGGVPPEVTDRITALEDTYVTLEIYESHTTDTGTVTIPTGAEILFDRYEDAGDALCLKLDTNGTPIDEVSRDSSGNITIVNSFDAGGNYTLSNTPSESPFGIVYQIRVQQKNLENVPTTSILNRTQQIDSNDVNNLSLVEGATLTDALNTLEGFSEFGLFSSLLSGGDLSINADNTKFDLAVGSGIIVNNYTDDTNPTQEEISWVEQLAITVTGLATSDVTYLGMQGDGNGNGLLVQSPTPIETSSQRDIIPLGYIIHQSRTQIDSIQNSVIWGRDNGLVVNDYLNSLGVVTRSGNIYSANGTDLKIKKSAGTTFASGRNYSNNRKDPNITNDPSVSPVNFLYGWRDGVGGSNFTPATDINPNLYDDGSGTLQPVPAGKYSTQRIFYVAGSNTTSIQYGENVYNTIEAARNEILTESFQKLSELDFAAFRCWLIVGQGTTDLSNTAVVDFVPAGKLGDIGLSSGAGSAVGDLQVAYNNRTQTYHIVTNSTNNAMSVQDTISGNTYEGYNLAGDLTFAVDHEGSVTSRATKLDIVNAPSVTGEGTLWWNGAEHTLNIETGLGPTLQVGQEQYILFYNDTGSTISNGKILHPIGGTSSGGVFVPTVELALSDKFETCQGTLFVATADIPNNSLGIGSIFGKVRDVDTSGFGAGAQLWLSDTNPGDFTDIQPEFPSYIISMGGTLNSDPITGQIFVSITTKVEDTVNSAWDGAIRETFDFVITSDGVTVTGSLSNADNPANGLTALFSDGFYEFDCTPPSCDITLTPGTVTAPQENYVYIDASTKNLAVSLTGFPVTEHAKIAKVALFDAVSTQNNGAIRNQNINDHIKSTNDNGHILHITERLRALNAEWDNGTAATLVGTPSNVYINVTSGEVLQLHKQSFPALSMPTNGIHVFNDPDTPYRFTNNLNDITQYSNGTNWNNDWSNLVVWGVCNKSGEPSHLMVNLPSDGYNTEANAIEDRNNFSNYTIPKEFKGVGFLIGRFTIRKGGSNFTYNDATGYLDLRGNVPNNTAGGGTGSSGVIEFTQLTDTPISYVGNAGYVTRVNSGETVLEFVDLNVGGTLSNVAYKDQSNTFTQANTFNNQVNIGNGSNLVLNGDTSSVLVNSSDYPLFTIGNLGSGDNLDRGLFLINATNTGTTVATHDLRSSASETSLTMYRPSGNYGFKVTCENTGGNTKLNTLLGGVPSVNEGDLILGANSIDILTLSSLGGSTFFRNGNDPLTINTPTASHSRIIFNKDGVTKWRVGSAAVSDDFVIADVDGNQVFNIDVTTEDINIINNLGVGNITPKDSLHVSNGNILAELRVDTIDIESYEKAVTQLDIQDSVNGGSISYSPSTGISLQLTGGFVFSANLQVGKSEKILKRGWNGTVNCYAYNVTSTTSIQTSPDGINWTTQASKTSGAPSNFQWSPGTAITEDLYLRFQLVDGTGVAGNRCRLYSYYITDTAINKRVIGLGDAVVANYSDVGIGTYDPVDRLDITIPDNTVDVGLTIKNNDGSIAIQNATNVADEFAPNFLSKSKGDNQPTFFASLIPSGNDTGSTPVTVFRAGRQTSATVTDRPLFQFQNWTSPFTTVNANGVWEYFPSNTSGAKLPSKLTVNHNGANAAIGVNMETYPGTWDKFNDSYPSSHMTWEVDGSGYPTGRLDWYSSDVDDTSPLQSKIMSLTKDGNLSVSNYLNIGSFTTLGSTDTPDHALRVYRGIDASAHIVFDTLGNHNPYVDWRVQGDLKFTQYIEKDNDNYVLSPRDNITRTWEMSQTGYIAHKPSGLVEGSLIQGDIASIFTSLRLENTNSSGRAQLFISSGNTNSSSGGASIRFNAGAGTNYVMAGLRASTTNNGAWCLVDSNDIIDAQVMFAAFKGTKNIVIGETTPTDNGTDKLQVTGTVNASGGYKVGANTGVSGTFTSNDGKTITVTNGIITAIV